MAQLLPYILIIAAPAAFVFFFRRLNISKQLMFGVLTVIGSVLTYFCYTIYSRIIAAEGNNINIGGLLLIVWAVLLYLIISPLLIFVKRKN